MTAGRAQRNGRRRRALWPVLALWMGCSGLCVHAAEPARDPVARGEQLARQQCSACHVVASNQELPPLRQFPTPSFYEIANRPKTSEKSLEHFIGSTHWDMKTVPMSMPDQMLTNEEKVAVSRYILSLRKR